MGIEDLIARAVQTLPLNATCTDAAKLMRDEEIGAVVVVEDERPVGMVTDRDLVLRVVASGKDAQKLSVREVMSSEPVFLEEGRSLDQAIRTMRDQRVRRLIVVEPDGRLEGLVSLDDLLALFGDQLGDIAEAMGR